MKRYAIGLLALCLAVIVASPAMSAPDVAPNFNIPVAVAPGNQYAIITNAMGTAVVNITYAGTFCASGCTGTSAVGVAPQQLVGIVSLSGSTNTGTIKCSDTYSGALGTPILEGVALTAAGAAGSSVFPEQGGNGGLKLNSGLSCQMSTAASVADGILVIYR